MSRIIEIDNELKQLNRKKSELLKERRRLRISGAEPENPELSRAWTDRAWLIINSNPGASRDTIRQELGPLDPILWRSEQRLTNTLTTLRRRGWIVNRGTKKRPKWHALDRQSQSPWSDRVRLSL